MRHLFIEPELAVLLELLRLLDRELDSICRKAMTSADPDSFGYFDVAEHVTGLAFVLCQTYMATVYGALAVEKRTALSLGPQHAGGMAKAEVVNHAANYWKHNNEWALDRSPSRRESIANAFDSVGFPVGTDYPLSGVLTELSAPATASLSEVAGLLGAWKREVYDAA